MKNGNSMRGDAQAPPDHFYIPEGDDKDTHADDHRLERGEAIEYRHFTSGEAESARMPRPWRPIDIDPTMKYMRERSRYLVN